jgi:hypothetical protein
VRKLLVVLSIVVLVAGSGVATHTAQASPKEKQASDEGAGSISEAEVLPCTRLLQGDLECGGSYCLQSESPRFVTDGSVQPIISSEFRSTL